MKNHQFLGRHKSHNMGSRGAKVSLKDKYQLVLLIIPGLEVLKRKSNTVVLLECQAAMSHIPLLCQAEDWRTAAAGGNQSTRSVVENPRAIWNLH